MAKESWLLCCCFPVEFLLFHKNSFQGKNESWLHYPQMIMELSQYGHGKESFHARCCHYFVSIFCYDEANPAFLIGSNSWNELFVSNFPSGEVEERYN